MNYVIDLIIIAIIAICVLISAKRGFVKVVIEVVGFVAVCIFAFSVNMPLSEATYDKFIEPTIVKAVNASVEDTSLSTKDDVFNSLPSFLAENAENLGISIDSFYSKITDNVSSGVETAVTTASQDVIKPIFTKILGTIYAVVIILVLLFVVKILANLINKLFSFSIVGKTNRVLGGIIGLPKGIVFAIIFCLLISLIVSLSGGFLIFTPENIDKTILFKLLAGII